MIMCIWACMFVQVHMEAWAHIRNLPQLLWSFFIGAVSQLDPELTGSSQPPSGISCFCLWSLGLQVATFPWHLGSRAPNSGSHMFMASVLFTEPSLSPLSLCFYLSWRKSIRTASNFGSKCFDSLCTNSLDRYTIMFIITFSYYLEGILPYRVLLTLIRKIPAVILILWRYFAFVYCFSYTVMQLVAICSFWGSIKGVIESCKTTNWQFTVYSLW